MSTESVDGKYLYFSRKRSGRQDPENAIWRIPVEGGEEQAVIESLYCWTDSVGACRAIFCK
ncbi:hypothetical protein MYX75_09040 [Acidobacteria bacterium AH-259-A15]|nr:hypothetical protein [Acidobacteria bacterium AH-259-A15]